MSHSEPIDWSQLWYPGPRRVFTDAELARAGGDRPSRTLTVVLVINLAIWAQMLLQAAPPELTARLTAFLAGLAVAALTQARALWRRPTRRALLRRTLAVLGVFQLLVLGITPQTPDLRCMPRGIEWYGFGVDQDKHRSVVMSDAQLCARVRPQGFDTVIVLNTIAGAATNRVVRCPKP